MSARRGTRKSNRFATLVALIPAAALVACAIAGSQSAAAQSRGRDAPANFVQWRAGLASNVLVHCQVNMRGSAFVYLYRVIYEGAAAQQEAAKLTGVWVPNRVWKKFIDDTLAAHGKKGEIL